MDKEFVNEVYNLVKEQGYTRDFETFVQQLRSSEDFRNELYAYVREEGYQRPLEDFQREVGIKAVNYANLSTREAQRLKELRDKPKLTATEKAIKEHLEKKLGTAPEAKAPKDREAIIKEAPSVQNFPYTTRLAYDEGSEASLFDKGTAFGKDILSYPGRLVATAFEPDFSSMGVPSEEREGMVEQIVTSPLTGAAAVLGPLAARASTLGVSPWQGALAAGTVEGVGTGIAANVFDENRTGGDAIRDLVLSLGTAGMASLATLPKGSAVKKLGDYLKKAGYPDKEASTLAKKAYEETFTTPKLSTQKVGATIQEAGKKGLQEGVQEAPLFLPGSQREMGRAAQTSHEITKRMRDGASLLDLPPAARFRDVEQLVDASIAKGTLPQSKRGATIQRINDGLAEIKTIQKYADLEVIPRNQVDSRIREVINNNADIPEFVEMVTWGAEGADELRLFSNLANYSTQPAFMDNTLGGALRATPRWLTQVNTAPTVQAIGYGTAPAFGQAAEQAVFGPQERK